MERPSSKFRRIQEAANTVAATEYSARLAALGEVEPPILKHDPALDMPADEHYLDGDALDDPDSSGSVFQGNL